MSRFGQDLEKVNTEISTHFICGVFVISVSMGESDLDNGPVSAHICGAFVIRVSMGKSDLNNGPVSAHICGAGPIESLR